eukprot:793179-Rhodomonas_salina.1
MECGIDACGASSEYSPFARNARSRPRCCFESPAASNEVCASMPSLANSTSASKSSNSMTKWHNRLCSIQVSCSVVAQPLSSLSTECPRSCQCANRPAGYAR